MLGVTEPVNVIPIVLTPEVVVTEVDEIGNMR
jgi:hypothetical protein